MQEEAIPNSNLETEGPGRRNLRRAVDSSREWFDLRGLTQYADVSERTLRSWIYAAVDPLPAAKVSGKVPVRKSDFDEYLLRHRIKPLESLNVDRIVREVLEGVNHGR
jgi:hypothetical protein